MRHVFIAALAFTPCVVLSGGAIYLAAHGIDGWGWFLFVATVVAGSYSYNSGGSN